MSVKTAIAAALVGSVGLLAFCLRRWRRQQRQLVDGLAQRQEGVEVAAEMRHRDLPHKWGSGGFEILNVRAQGDAPHPWKNSPGSYVIEDQYRCVGRAFKPDQRQLGLIAHISSIGSVRASDVARTAAQSPSRVPSVANSPEAV